MLDSTQHATLARTFLALAERADELDHSHAVHIELGAAQPLETLADRIRGAAREDVAASLESLAAALADAHETAAGAVRNPLSDAETALEAALDAVRDCLRGERVDVGACETARYHSDESTMALDSALDALDADADPVEVLADHGDPAVLDEFIARLSVAARLDAYNGHTGWSPVSVTLDRLGLLDHVARLAGITTGVDPLGRYGLDPVR